jgi:hypothetical protein
MFLSYVTRGHASVSSTQPLCKGRLSRSVPQCPVSEVGTSTASWNALPTRGLLV